MEQNENSILNPFDIRMGELEGVPGIVKSKPTTLTTMVPVVGTTQTFIVQTFRHNELGDTIFLQMLSDREKYRIAIPPAVASAIARQHDAMGTKNRSRSAKQVMADRMARGDWKPGFNTPEARKKALAARRKKAAARRKEAAK